MKKMSGAGKESGSEEEEGKLEDKDKGKEMEDKSKDAESTRLKVDKEESGQCLASDYTSH